MRMELENIDTVVIGAGQAGLSVGYFLARRGAEFTILEANARVGDNWRARWDSLRLFTPSRFDGLVGMPFPAPAHSFPTKNEMADYLESYAARFRLPVRTGVRVQRLSRTTRGFLVDAGGVRIAARTVIVAMASYQQPQVPGFAGELAPHIVQLHSSEYRNPAQLQEGPVLLVGAGNSGAEIARELCTTHETWVSGRDVGQLPFRIDGPAARVLLVRLVLRGLFHRVLTVDTPVGRRAMPKLIAHGGPLIRTRRRDLAGHGVHFVPRTRGVRDGLPVLEDGRRLPVANVVWCTGFRPGLSWIDLPVFGPDGRPLQERGVAATVPGLGFVGLHFQRSLSSTMIHGVARDAAYVVNALA